MQAGLKKASLLNRIVYICKLEGTISIDTCNTNCLIVINNIGDLSTDFAMFSFFSRRSKFLSLISPHQI